jgi:hypothetical protein
MPQATSIEAGKSSCRMATMLSPSNGAADRDCRRAHQKRRRDNQRDAGAEDEIVGLADQ